FIRKMVGAVRFELTTSCTRNKRATRLRYAPTLKTRTWREFGTIATEIWRGATLGAHLDAPLGGPRLWRSPAAARLSKVRRQTLTRGEMMWLLRLGFATAAGRYRTS